MSQSSSEERSTMYTNNRQQSPEEGAPLMEPSSIPLNVLITQHRRPPKEVNGRSEESGLIQSIPPILNDMSSYDCEQQLLEYDPAQTPSTSSKANGARHKSRQQLGPGWQTGWRGGLSIAAGLTLLILISNITILGVFSSPAYRRDYSSTTAPIRTGECDDIKKLNIGIHLLINIASTILLGASNYCMQTISAPTRHDIDMVHASGKWLRIGVPSLRNLRFIGKKRVFIWLCLAATSLPLHLVYNSVFFVSTSYNNYRMYIADTSFATGAPYNEDIFNVTQEMRTQLINGTRYQVLSKSDCIEAYAQDLIQDRGNVILFVEPPQDCSVFQTYDSRHVCADPSTTSLYASHDCKYSDDVQFNDGFCTTAAWKGRMHDNNWEVAGVKVKYCLSEQTPSRCWLHIATNLVAVVVAFNLAKLILITYILFGNWVDWDPLVTIGDAIASFLNRPDPKTRGMCLLATEEILEFWGGKPPPPQEYRTRRYHWVWVVSTRILVVTICLIAAALTILIYYLIQDTGNLPYSSAGDIWSLGVGKTSSRCLISWLSLHAISVLGLRM